MVKFLSISTNLYTFQIIACMRKLFTSPIMTFSDGSPQRTQLVLGQVAGPRPAPLLVGEGDRFVRLSDPVVGRVLDGGFPKHVDREPVRLEDLVPRSPLGMLVYELLHELLGEGYVLGRDRFDPGIGPKQRNLLGGEAHSGHKETSDESVIGGNLFGGVFFLDCPNYGVQFMMHHTLFF